jgi:hypothetical protein
MNTSFNFSFSSSFGNQNATKNQKRKLTAQDEYWLNRILRDHSGQIFILIFLLLAIIFGTIIYGILNPQNRTISGEYSLIQINAK